MVRGVAGAALGAWFGAAAAGQSTTSSTVSFALSWRESDDLGNPVTDPDGMLEPGEHALLSLAVSFTNQNTVGTYAPFPPGPGWGTIRGFAGGFIDLHGSSNLPGGAQGMWNTDQSEGFGIDWNWFIVVGPNPNGTPTNGGANLTNIQFLQVATTPAAIMTTNPIVNIWRGLWTPASLSARTVAFDVTPGYASGGLASGVLFETSATQTVGANCPSIFGSVNIPIVPAPGVTAFALACAGSVVRRRRTPARPT
jgi:hypothetical protein